MSSPVRILTAVPICDGHDSAINTINLEFIRHGIEVVYLGFHRYAGDIVRAAIQEDVAAIGISSYNGGHIDFFAEVVRQLRRQGAGDIAVFGGGGGTITHDDARLMKRQGVDQIFFAGTSLTEMADYVRKHYGKPRKKTGIKNQDLALARELTAIEDCQEEKSRDRNPRIDEIVAIEKCASHRLYRPRRGGQDDLDRRIGPALFATRAESADCDSVARSQRDR